MMLAIVPAHNEEKTIGHVVSDLLAYVDNVVVVDDGSHDQTGYLAQSAGAVVLRHDINRGQGAALETGHSYARQVNADIVVDFDADGQFAGAAIAEAKKLLESTQADILFGSRFLGMQSSVPWVKRLILLPIGRIVSQFFGAPRLSDAHNGFRMYTKKALECIRITQDRMAHATEIPVLAKQHGLAIVEFPITVTYHEFGQRGSAGVGIVEDLVVGTFVK